MLHNNVEGFGIASGKVIMRCLFIEQQVSGGIILLYV